jgi:hypothetical protein
VSESAPAPAGRTEAPEATARERVPAGPDLGACFREARALLRSQPQHGADGRFVAGNTEPAGTLAHSAQLWALVAPACEETAARVRVDLGLDHGSASEIQRGMVDNYVQARLLRESLWASLVDRGGPITAKGNARRVLAAYWQASDRERDRAQLLGLQRQARKVPTLADVMREDADA